MDSHTLFGDLTARDWQTVTDAGPLRLAMVGFGWWTREQAIPAVDASDLCETTVVVTGSVENERRIRATAETIDHVLDYDAYHEGVASDAYDAVYVATPNALHLPYVETAAELGKAALCEKPMEVDVDRARRLVEACEDADVPLMVGYRMQTDPTVRRAREAVAGGVVGDPVQVHSHMSQPLLEMNPNPDQWRLDPDRSGGAAVMDLGIYPLNTTRFVLGGDPVAVSAQTASESEAFARVPDEHASFTLTFPGDVRALCTVSQAAATASHFHLVGTEGELRIDPAYFPWQDRALELRSATGTTRYEPTGVDQMTEEFDYFADRVLTGGDIHPDGRHGLADVRALRAVYDAAARDERLALDHQSSTHD